VACRSPKGSRRACTCRSLEVPEPSRDPYPILRPQNICCIPLPQRKQNLFVVPSRKGLECASGYATIAHGHRVPTAYIYVYRSSISSRPRTWEPTSHQAQRHQRPCVHENTRGDEVSLIDTTGNGGGQASTGGGGERGPRLRVARRRRQLPPPPKPPR
jgi:hypothetical protein